MCWTFSDEVSLSPHAVGNGVLGKREMVTGVMRGRTDMIIPLLEMAVEIVDVFVVFRIIDMEFEGVDADNGSYIDFSVEFSRASGRWYHIADADFRPSGRICLLGRVRSRSRT